MLHWWCCSNLEQLLWYQVTQGWEKFKKCPDQKWRKELTMELISFISQRGDEEDQPSLLGISKRVMVGSTIAIPRRASDEFPTSLRQLRALDRKQLRTTSCTSCPPVNRSFGCTLYWSETRRVGGWVGLMAAGIAAWPDIDPRSGEAPPEAPTNTLVFSRIGDNINKPLSV